uniref:Citramalyl-CoA lyase, mitochondrial n=1 Tax=Diabrotica virgifera virgifera TaxID=50390 RepID=A0A6P7FEK8_DIAVI
MASLVKSTYVRKIQLLKENILRTAVRNYKPRRALMYVPGNDLRKISKISSLNVDCIALDCEDGVAFNKKDEARQTIRDSLAQLVSNSEIKSDIGVRVNSIDSDMCEKDLEVCLSGKVLPHTVLLPKVEESDHLRWFSEKLDKSIQSSNKVNLIIYIESAKAFTNLTEICKTAVELSEQSKFVPNSLVFGSDDFCASIGATRTEDAIEVLYARQMLVLNAKAFNLQAIDMVYINYKDLGGLKRQSEQGMRMGYTGKQVIHPGQIQVVQEAFLPSEEKIEWARGLLHAFKEHQATGKGAFTYRGSMIDMPTMKQAQNVIDLVNSTKK